MLFPALRDAAYVLDIAANLTRNTLRREEKRDGKVVSGTSGRSETIPSGSDSKLSQGLGPNPFGRPVSTAIFRLVYKLIFPS